MSDDAVQIPFADLVDGFTTEPLDDGDEVVSIFGLVKLRDTDGDVQWAIRSGGETQSLEELLGALSGLVASIQRDLAADWEW
jgi:hypothetical protein